MSISRAFLSAAIGAATLLSPAVTRPANTDNDPIADGIAAGQKDNATDQQQLSAAQQQAAAIIANMQQAVGNQIEPKLKQLQGKVPNFSYSVDPISAAASATIRTNIPATALLGIGHFMCIYVSPTNVGNNQSIDWIWMTGDSDLQATQGYQNVLKGIAYAAVRQEEKLTVRPAQESSWQDVSCMAKP